MLSSSFVAWGAGWLAAEDFKNTRTIHRLERQVAAEQAHSATCNWGCPSTLERSTAEYERRISAFEVRCDDVAAMAAIDSEVAAESLRVATAPVRVEVSAAAFAARISAMDSVLMASCAFWTLRHQRSPQDLRFAEWTSLCNAAGYTLEETP